MNERTLNNSAPPATEKLANFYGSLADDVLDGYIEIDEETNWRAARVVLAITEKPGPGIGSDFGVEITPQTLWVSKGAIQTRSLTRHRMKSWFARWFGLNPSLAGLLTAAALVSTAFGWGTLGLGFVFEMPIAAIFGFLTFLIQKRFEGDDFRTAVFKGVTAAVLLAIPLPLAPFIFIPAGIVKPMEQKKDETKTSEAQRTEIKGPVWRRDGLFWRRTDETKTRDTHQK